MQICLQSCSGRLLFWRQTAICRKQLPAREYTFSPGEEQVPVGCWWVYRPPWLRPYQRAPASYSRWPYCIHKLWVHCTHTGICLLMAVVKHLDGLYHIVGHIIYEINPRSQTVKLAEETHVTEQPHPSVNPDKPHMVTYEVQSDDVRLCQNGRILF